MATVQTTARGMTSEERKVIFASSLGTVFEWYDFYLYGSLAAIIAKQFFAGTDPTTAFIFALLAFAAGFIVRPFGALVFGRLGDMIGRKYTFLMTILIMGISTFLVGLLPSYASIGIAAPIILITLRILQGLCMASAFTLTLAYLGEHYSAQDSASAFAAYITGNVASNLIGRLVSAGIADHFGLAANFYFFAALNLLGALLVYFTVEKTPPMRSTAPGMRSHFSAWIMHLKNPPLRASFAIGFCILSSAPSPT